MSVAGIRQVAQVGEETAPGSGVVLEASGKMPLDRLRQLAEAGAERVSAGALARSAPGPDRSTPMPLTGMTRA
ncbi:hypothetical protein [Streptomyces sp. NPDC048637]|uniref:hypothetical protein n=1 Tax=Streptomyces sp. NPDC048637 TaxID=3155636 RepID=UPI003434503D